MAVDIWPYSGRLGGAVSDLEHEYLWSAMADGVLPDQSGNPCLVGISGGQWTVQPGRFLIAGHVVDITTQQSGPLPELASATRRSIVTAYVDHSKSPWEYGVRLHPGAPGGGRPSLTRSRTGMYEVPLRAIDTAPSGNVTLLPDERVVLTPAGGGLLRGTNTAATPSQVPLLVIGAQGQLGDMVSVRKSDGFRLLDVSEVGRVGINTNGAGSSTGLYVKGAAAGDTTLRVAAVTGQTGNLIAGIDPAGAGVFIVDVDGNLKANNFDATNWASFTPTWGGTGAATFSSRTGRWKRIAQKTVSFRVYLKVGVAGTSVGADVNFQLPTTPNRAVEHVFHGRSRGPGFLLEASAFSGGSSTTVNEIAMVNSADTHNLRGDDLEAGMEIIISGIYEEA